ncbi:WD40 repeat domain-containing protein [Streptacidiphilus anmyonensis]|uniref:WD40 repeat domain-containing protein n=1 Tax=Streptacidiphilus anmyonensis TaxID=405782 RepID=UPI0005A7604C|nr:WD40 repeat domain-containing protein [Streptacidiphilus anmyonensis]
MADGPATAEDPTAQYQSALGEFASRMDRLYVSAGAPPLSELVKASRATGDQAVSAAGMSEVLHGRRFPGIDYTITMVRLLADGQPTLQTLDEWRERWRAVKILQRSSRAHQRQRDQELPVVPRQSASTPTPAAPAHRPPAQAAPAETSCQTCQGLARRLGHVQEARNREKERTNHLVDTLLSQWPEQGLTLFDQGTVPTAVFFPDGTTIAVSANGGLVSFWDPATGRLKGKPVLHGTDVDSMAISLDGTWLVTTSLVDGRTRYWGTEHRELVGEHHIEGFDYLSAIRVTADLDRIVAAAGQAVLLWDGALQEPIFRSVGSQPTTAVAVSNDDPPRLAAGTAGGAVHLISTPSGSGHTLTPGGTRNVQYLTFSPTPRFLGAVDADGNVRVWRLEGENVQLAGTITGWSLELLAFSEDEQYLATGGTDGTVRFWALSGGLPPLGEPIEPAAPVPVASLSLSPDNRIVAIGYRDGTMRLRRVPTTTNGDLAQTPHG